LTSVLCFVAFSLPALTARPHCPPSAITKLPSWCALSYLSCGM